MDVALFRERLPEKGPRQRASGFGLEGDLEIAMRRSQAYLLSQQKPEGYWIGELMVDATLVADMIAYRHWDGKVDPQWQRKAVNHIFSMQLPDGGWNIYYGGPAEVNATIKAYLALKLAGVPVTDPRMLRAREVALSLGGVPRMNTFSKLYLALLGLFPWEYVPTIPCEVILIGKWFYVNFNEMSSWSRSMLVPLAIINHFKPTRPPRNINLNELYPEGIHERDLALAPDPERLTWRNFFLWLDRVHKFAEWFAENGIHPFRKRALRKAEQWMLERFEGSDGLAAIFPGMLNSLIALKALGYPDDHPQVLRIEQPAQEARARNRTHRPHRALPVAGLGHRHRRHLPPRIRLARRPSRAEAGRRTGSSTKEIRFRGDWQYKNPAKVEPSGWAFEFENKWNPDVDDTAMVLLALRKVPTEDRQKARRTLSSAGLKWMMTFQCRDGGWASFDKDCTKGVLEKVPFADHNAMLDPECADITARILELLGYEGYSAGHPQVQKALRFIREHQEEDGSWYGRWGVNYIYGTWQVLRGLRALNLNMEEPWLLKARDWLRSIQHEDGGWGERCNTYEDPVFKGQGPSTASQTAWALMGLCAFDDPHHPSLRRGRRVPHPLPEPGRLLDRTRGHRHRFSQGLLSQVRHVPEQPGRCWRWPPIANCWLPRVDEALAADPSSQPQKQA